MGMVLKQRSGPVMGVDFLTVLLPDGHVLSLLSNYVTFRFPGWGKMPESLPAPKAITAPGMALDTRSALEELEIPETITSSLASLQKEVHSFTANHKARAMQMYPGLPEIETVSVEEAGQWIFQKVS